MRVTNFHCIKKKQKGIALLVLIISIALTISIYYFSQISIAEIKADKQQETRLALAQAKKLLLGYAVVRADLASPMVPSTQSGRYGYLPCPAINNGEGNSVGTCGSKDENTFGWFPWGSLKSIPIKDGNGNCLLYVVSGSYKHSPSPDMLNEDTNGMFQIVDEVGVVKQGAVAAERVVAIVFSSGNALAGQNRGFQNGSICGNDATNYDSAYLDSYEISPGVFIDNSGVVTGNSDEVYQFVQASITSDTEVFNDQFIIITREELWSEIAARSDLSKKITNLTEALALCLNDYAVAKTDHLPWPAPMALADYRIESNYDDTLNSTLGYAGRFPFIVSDSNAVLGGSNNELFTEAACGDRLLPAGGVNADLLGMTSNEYQNLWKNWKDHFFYILSKGYEPGSAANCLTDCIMVNGIKRAAAVIFAGSGVGQLRTGPVASGDVDTKSAINNYLENGNETQFPDATGNGVYVTGGNDIMFCIDEGLGVLPC